MSQSSIVTNALTGITPSNLPYNARQVLDANYIKTTSLPSSASTVYSASLDLGDPVSGIPYSTTEIVNFQIVAPDLSSSPKIADAGTVTYTVQDSADNVTFAAITGLSTLVQTGAGGTGAAAATRTIKLPPATRRYVRVSAVTATSPGDLSTASFTTQLVF